MKIYQFAFPENEFPGLHLCEEFGEVEFHDAVRLEGFNDSEQELTAISCVIVVILHRRWLRKLRKRIRPLGYEVGQMEVLPKNTCRAQFNRVENVRIEDLEEE